MVSVMFISVIQRGQFIGYMNELNELMNLVKHP